LRLKVAGRKLEELRDVQSDCRSLKSRLKTTEVELEETRRTAAECQSLRTRMQSATQELAATRAAVKLSVDLRKEMQELQEQSRATQTELRETRDNLDASRRQHEQTGLALATTRQRLRESQVASAGFQEEMQRLRQALSGATGANDELKQTLQTTSSRLQRRLAKEQQQKVEEDLEAAKTGKRVEDMQHGALFEKLAFHKDRREQRFVRLSFDTKRIEWGVGAGSTKKALPVEAIVRIDYGDASRAYRCCEYLRNRPLASRCFTIASASRTLDLIATDDLAAEAWVLGLNSLIPALPERRQLISQDFHVRSKVLQLELAPGAGVGDLETMSNASAATMVSKPGLPVSMSRDSRSTRCSTRSASSVGSSSLGIFTFSARDSSRLPLPHSKSMASFMCARS